MQGELAKQGPSFTKDEHHANGRISRIGPIQRNRKECIVRGRCIPVGDCESQDVTICEFHFVAIDYGDAIRVSEGLERETKNIEYKEPNQCVLLHLVAGMQWARMKRQHGIPEKYKVLLEVEEWRREEIEQAKEASKWCAERWLHG